MTVTLQKKESRCTNAYPLIAIDKGVIVDQRLHQSCRFGEEVRVEVSLLILAAALCAGLTVATGLWTWNLSLSVNDVTRSLDAYYRAGQREAADGAVERMGQALLRRMPAGRFNLERFLVWIALEEAPPTPARIAGTAGLLGQQRLDTLRTSMAGCRAL